MSFFQMFLFFVELVFLAITGYYFLKAKNKTSSLEIQEIKLNAGKKKFDKETAELNVLKKRLDEQKVVLDRQWNQLQADQKTIEERALAIENDRKLLEQQKSEFSNQKIDIEQQQLKIEKFTENIETKWEQQQNELELEKEKLKAKAQQLNISISNLEAEKEKLKLERQKIEKSERFISDKFNELKRLKAELERQQEQFSKQKQILPKTDRSFEFEPSRIKNREAEKSRYNRKTEAEKRPIQKQQQDKSQKIQTASSLKQEEKAKLQTKKPEVPETTHREVSKSIPKVAEIKEIIEIKSASETSDVKKIDEEKQSEGEERAPKLVPDIICWKVDEAWNIAIKFSGKMVNPALIRVIQNNVRLKKHEIKEEYWNIKSLASLFVQWQENNEISFKQVEFNKKGKDGILIFKLSEPDLSYGRFVSYPTIGNYLVIVPGDWERVDNETGDPDITPQLTNLEKYVGHLCFFDGNTNKSLGFKKKDGTTITIEAQSSRFFLKGNQLMDASEGVVPLFGEELPTVVDQQGPWDDMGTIMVAELREDGFEWLLTPQPGRVGQDLNGFDELEITKSSSSHFQVSIYDRYDNLVESMDFRYVEGLKRVKVFEPPAFPGPDGHQPGYVKFYHNQKCTIDLVKNYGNWHDIIVHNNEFTVATIPPDPSYDQTEWDICDQSGRKIRIKIEMQRVWWTLATQPGELERIKASDKLLELSSAMMAGDSNAGICAWVPKKCRGKKISVGFSPTHQKVLLCNGIDQSIFIPLHEFEDVQHIHNQKESSVLKLWLNDNSQERVSLAELVFPLMFCKADKCEFKTNIKNELIVHIKTSHFPQFFKTLNYEDIRSKYDRSLPVAIYQCDYCNTYILADHDTTNPTATIIDHIEKCPEVDRESRLVVRFKQVTDISEIREKVMNDLPVVNECTFCGQFFENQDEDSLIDHLLKNHESDLYAYQKPGTKTS